jgi:putative addiction module component (TIGR02574 family)
LAERPAPDSPQGRPEDMAREAIELPRHQRLSLARLLIELDDPGSDADVEAAWDAEIQARIRAVKEGRVEGIPYEEVLARVDRRLAR